ncbi:MAG TPA: SwmB domain-containing protein [Pseudonocardiaceae bacterium]|nr:SwmB domain-containing protein [Pseudonocardiaceae bacterium]
MARRLGLLIVIAALGVVMAIGSAGAALASQGPGGGGGGGGGGLGRLRATGSCGDILDLRLKTTGGPITVTVTVPSPDPSEVWNLTVTQQEYGATTGARLGNPVVVTPNPMPPLAYSLVEGGFSTTADFTNTTGRTHGWSYVATRTSPTPLTCTNQGFWTNPGGTSAGPVAENPVGRPDTAPVLTGATEADQGTNTVALQFDQEMLTAAQGIPAINRFAVTVNGTARDVTAVSLVDDVPPDQAVLSLTLAGAVLPLNGTVTVQYRQPLFSSDPALQDLEAHETLSFGPVSIPVF